LTDLLLRVLGWVLRLGLLLAGLVFFASVLVAAVLLLCVWLLRALWSTLTGQPVRPWTFQMHRASAWGRFYPRRAAAPARSAGLDDAVDVAARDVGVVTDVEPKRITPSPH